MPMLWTGLTFGPMSLINPELSKGVSWPWFIASQFVFGIVVAAAIAMLRYLGPLRSGLVGGAAGGLLMPIPALLWGSAAGTASDTPRTCWRGWSCRTSTRSRPLT